jgi:hypothetical protein
MVTLWNPTVNPSKSSARELMMVGNALGNKFSAVAIGPSMVVYERGDVRLCTYITFGFPVWTLHFGGPRPIILILVRFTWVSRKETKRTPVKVTRDYAFPQFHGLFRPNKFPKHHYHHNYHHKGIICGVVMWWLRAGLHYGGEGLWSVKNAWPRHGYMR